LKAGRHARHVVKLARQNIYRNFDFKRAGALVDAALKLPPLREE
jgi:hypothetical protein